MLQRSVKLWVKSRACPGCAGVFCCGNLGHVQGTSDSGDNHAYRVSGSVQRSAQQLQRGGVCGCAEVVRECAGGYRGDTVIRCVICFFRNFGKTFCGPALVGRSTFPRKVGRKRWESKGMRTFLC